MRHLFLPVSLAWDAFGMKNGAKTFDRFFQSIMRLNKSGEVNPTIGCTILTEPFFSKLEDWIPIPQDWSSNIVKGKSYDTEETVGAALWKAVQERRDSVNKYEGELVIQEPATAFGKTIEIRSRIGQGAFRAMVTDAWSRRCGITGEKTLPVLEAAHIKPYALYGPNLTSSGLLLRSDMHILFDKGYITLSKSNHVEVSKLIREEFENGKEYYRYHGRLLHHLPEYPAVRPSAKFLDWYQQEIYKG